MGIFFGFALIVLGIVYFKDSFEQFIRLIRQGLAQPKELDLARINLRVTFSVGLIYAGICFLNRTST